MGWKYIDINWKNGLRIYEKRETEIESNVAKEEKLKKKYKRTLFAAITEVSSLAWFVPNHGP